MGVRLTELAIQNTGAAIFTKIQAINARKVDQQTASELNGIINALIAENNELLGIAQAYEQELVAQRISDEEIAYIINSVVPALKKFAGRMRAEANTGEDEESAKRMEESIDAITPLLSVEMLKVLQLVGFNFKKAIGEPLTLLVQRLITSRMPLEQQDAHELSRLISEGNLKLLEIAEDEAATERLKQVMYVWRGESEAH